MSKPAPSRRSKEEREQEFVEAVEKLLGFYLMPWQKPLLIEIRRATMNGEPIDFDSLRRP